jgi:hypothetical protein
VDWTELEGFLARRAILSREMESAMH